MSSSHGPTTSKTRSCPARCPTAASPIRIPVLAPEGDPNSSLAANPTHNPNLGLNNPNFFNPGALPSPNPYDFSGDGLYEQSALYAASQLTYARQYPTSWRSGHRRCLAGHSPAQPGHWRHHAGRLRASGTRRQQRRRDQRQRLGAVQHDPGLRGRARPSSCRTPLSTCKTREVLFRPTAPPAIRSTSRRTTTPRSAAPPTTTPTPIRIAGDWGGIVFRNYDQAAHAQGHLPGRRHAGRPERQPTPSRARPTRCRS